MKLCRRVFALLLALTLMFPLLPGDFAAPLETKAKAIDSGPEFLTEIARNPNGSFVQTADIEISAPVKVNFTGTYDGKGFKITVKNYNVNLYNDGYANLDEFKVVGLTVKNYVGMKTQKNYTGGVFEHVSGTIKNVNVVLNDAKMYGRGDRGSDYFGGIVGKLDGGKLEKCSVSGTVTAVQKLPEIRYFYAPELPVDTQSTIEGDYTANPAMLVAGGAVGLATGNADIYACYSQVKIYTASSASDTTNSAYTNGSATKTGQLTSGLYLFAGAIAGEQANGAVRDCHVDGSEIFMANSSDFSSASSTRVYAGGLVGIKSYASSSLFFNLVTNTTINAKPTNGNNGYCGGTAGWFTSDPSIVRVTRNFGYNVTLTAPKNNELGYYGSSFTSDSVVTVATFTRITNKDVPVGTGNLSNSEFTYYYQTSGYKVPALIWRTVPAPTYTVKQLDADGFEIVLHTPTETPQMKSQGLSMDATNIRYELTVVKDTTASAAPRTVVVEESGSHTEKPEWEDFSEPVTEELDDTLDSEGRLDPPSAALDASKSGIVLIPPHDASVVWGTNEINLSESGSFIPLDGVSGGTAVFYARAVSTLAEEPPASSKKIKITVTRAQAAPQVAAELSTMDMTPFAVSETVKFTNAGSSPNFVPKTETSSSTMTLTYENFRIVPRSSATLRVWMNNSPALEATYNLAADGAPAAPNIFPGNNGDLSNGITITASSGTEIWYMLKGGKSTDTPPDRDDLVNGDGFEYGATKYTDVIPWADIKSEFDGADNDTLWIVAVAKKASESASAATTHSYSISSKPIPPAPTILLEGSSGNQVLDTSRYYQSVGMANPDKFVIEKAAGEPVTGEIWYTTNGSVPTVGGPNCAKYASGFELPANRSTVTINAIWFRDNYPPSSMATVTLNMYIRYGMPIFSLMDYQSIALRQTLELMVAPSDLPEPVRPQSYVNASDFSSATEQDLREYPGVYYGVLKKESGTFRYEDYAGQIPTVKYVVTYHAIGDEATRVEPERTYYLGTPEIRFYDSGGIETGVVNSTSGSQITLDGIPGQSVTVEAWLDTPAGTSFVKGESAKYTFTFYKPTELPVASPPTSFSNMTSLANGDAIYLTCDDQDARIFYSTTGAPVVSSYNAQDGSYTLGSGTYLYNSATGIKVSGTPGSNFVVQAGAIADGRSASEIARFYYTISALPTVYATPGEGTVIKGTEVTLATTTSGATIYYETATREDDLEDPVPNQSQVFATPIKIEQRTYIRAMAVKDGVQSGITEYLYKLAGQVDTPEPSIPSGSVVAKGTKLSLTTSTSGASIVYTKDGSDPTDETNTKRMFGSDIAIDAEEGKSVSISAYATGTGMTPSEVVSLSYTVSKSEEVITVNPPADSIIKPGDLITISTSVSGADIYYTTDGSEPTRQSKKGSSVTVEGTYGESFILRAVSATETTITTPFTFSYRLISRTPSPSASIPTGAVILRGATVTLTAPEGNIYYTTDGADPIAGGSQMYTQPFELSGSTVLKAVAFIEGKATSEISEYIYTMAGQTAAPTASLGSGAIDVGSRVLLSSSTEGATVYYTTNGATPSVDNLRDCIVYDGPITISRPVSIRMFALSEGMNPSVVNTVTYTVVYPVEEEPEPEQTDTRWDENRLFLFDQFVDSGEGPLFEDIVLRDSLTLTVVSASGDALPEGVYLVAERERNPSAEDLDAVERALDMRMTSLYRITIVDARGNPVQPLREGGVEIGIPIPEGYEDTIILICRINDNGTVTQFPTRRYGGMAYAVVDHFSKYAIAVPVLPEGDTSGFRMWYLWLVGAGAALAGAAALTAVTIKRRKNATSYE